ncbi:F510_1955 family glycosylhydrolase [Alkalibacillus silvisoli]|uniref:Glycosyl hydrolase n=1 Tax=Alkalibacillus silvisoli TaxID=392823 RepID=A0ABP3K069_9BACI
MRVVVISVGVIIVLMSSIWFMQSSETSGDVTFKHIHGLGYTESGELLVAAHDGLNIKDSEWYMADDRPLHDYMGFSVYESGFYSSGHPEPGSELEDPLGLVQSTDQGHTLEIHGFQGDIDFHRLAVGYNTEDLFLFNPTNHPDLGDVGFYYSADQSETWQEVEGEGLENVQITTVHNPEVDIAVHPDEEGKVAVSSLDGVYISDDYGETFEQITDVPGGVAVTFDFNNQLVVSTVSSELIKVDLDTHESETMSTPPIGEDIINYIANDPADSDVYAVASFIPNQPEDNLFIYISEDGGQSWETSVEQSKAVQ